MPIEGPEVRLVMGMLMADMAAAKRAGAPKRQRTDRSAVELVEQDTGRILWLAAKFAWQVLWRDRDGVTRRSGKGLSVPAADEAGVILTVEKRDGERRRLLVSARQRWNQLDTSTADRYPSTLCELPDAS